MKNKTPKDPFETRCWSCERITDPYQVFAACFFYAPIGAFRKTIRQVLLSAASSKVYHKEDPAAVLGLFKAITSVLLAAHQLYRQKKTSGLQITPEQFMDRRLYARSNAPCAEWNYLPKALTAKEYQNPYAVFRRFFKDQPVEKWQQQVEQALEYALAGEADDSGPGLLRLYIYLVKLVEAAHLIDVREVLHIGGHLKPAQSM